jgi:hypothetical protein
MRCSRSAHVRHDLDPIRCRTEAEYPSPLVRFIPDRSCPLVPHCRVYPGIYTTFYPYYDKVVHLVSGTAVALLGFIGVIFVDKYMKMNLTPAFILFFTILFGVALGAFWEMCEFLVDFIFGGNLAGPMQNSLNETMLDMLFVFAGSIIVAILGVSWFKHHQKEEITAGSTI